MEECQLPRRIYKGLDSTMITDGPPKIFIGLLKYHHNDGSIVELRDVKVYNDNFIYDILEVIEQEIDDDNNRFQPSDDIKPNDARQNSKRHKRGPAKTYGSKQFKGSQKKV